MTNRFKVQRCVAFEKCPKTGRKIGRIWTTVAFCDRITTAEQVQKLTRVDYPKQEVRIVG